MNVPTTVFVVDPDKACRDRLREMAEQIGATCKGYVCAEDFLAEHKDDLPGCLVAEFSLSGINGLELQEALAAQGISLPVIFVTRSAETPLVVRAIQGGAVTVLRKPVEDQDLWEALREAVVRSKQIQSTATAQRRARARFDALSRHERHVLPFILADLSDKRIAKHLGVSRRAVKQVRGGIFKKTRAGTVTELRLMSGEVAAGPRQSQLSTSVARAVSRQLRGTLQEHREMLASVSRTPVRELLGGVVHEISQPLQAIANFSQVIDDALRHDQPDVGQVREWNQMISKASRLAAEIVARFRPLVARPRGARSDESLEQIVRDSIQMLQFAARDRRVDVHYEGEDVTVNVDWAQLQQVMINLLKNAMDAVSENPPGDRAVAVRVLCDATKAEIVVSDNGSGVGESDAGDLFEPFHSSKDDGLGLGLATSKSIVESHGGRIWCEPNRPRGAAFHVGLPLSC